MARCGRCGLWESTPIDAREQKYGGTCLWYHIRLEKEAVYDKRECADYMERILPHDASWHFEHKIKRDNLGDAYEKAKTSDFRAKIAIGLSLTGLAWNFVKALL